MIFVNRDKFKRVNSKSTPSDITDDKVQTYEANKSQRNMAKVYINPNFKSKKDAKLEEENGCQVRNKKSNPNQMLPNTLSEIEKLSEGNQQKSQELDDRKLEYPTLFTGKNRYILPERNNCKIFLNPQFKKLTDNAQNLVAQKLETTKSLGFLQRDNTKLTNLKLSLNKQDCSRLSKDDISKKNLATLLTKHKNVVERSQRTIYSTSNKKQASKVFINPQFSSRQPNRSNVVGMSTKSISGPATIKTHSKQSNKLVKNLLFCQNELLKPSVSKVEINSSVSMELKKTIRKRKLSASFLESRNISDSRKLIFVSKTKLVRNSSKSSVNSDQNPVIQTRSEPNSLTRLPLKSPNSFYLVSRHKITKKRKRSMSSSSNSSKPSSLGKPPLVKIKSKNGKSLKIVRSEQKPLLDSIGAGNHNKRLLKVKDIISHHQKSRKFVAHQIGTQFPKVNISLNRNILMTKSKYIYKKKNLAVKKSISNIILKNKSIDSLPRSTTDKVNFIKSKYRLIRMNCLNKITKRSSRNFSSDKFFPESKKWLSPKKSSKGTFKRNPKHLSIVNIGGVFYHCSRNSLTKNKNNVKNVLLKDKSTTLQISGKKFKLENNGHTLKCLDRKPGRKRIDIGGITFISSSSGKSLTRTNYHLARSIILQARQKRISQLTRKLRKNNEHCPFYHRYGKCSGKEQGTCTRQHDPKYVTVCKKFVQGSCTDIRCLLSHQISHHNLPTCQHFLAGQCGRDNCPYPHIKVSDEVPICIDFLKGFCHVGAQCTKRHFEMCPAFEKGSCSRGKYCPYPHPKSKTIKKVKRNQINRKCLTKAPEVVSNPNVRYFEDAFIQKENDIKLENKASEEEDATSSNDEERIHPKRPRLGRLPSFIPLSFDKSFSEYSQEL